MAVEERALTLAEKMKELDLNNPKHVAWVMATSGLFNDVKDMTQALVKVQAGRELGLGAFASMQAFDIVEGSLRIGSGQLASWVKASEKYDYRVREHTAQGCRIEWLQREVDGEFDSIGFSDWTEEDRDRAGILLRTKNGYPTVWSKYPKAMMFARAISNGVATYCADVVPTGSRVYTEGDYFGPRDEGYEERTGQPVYEDPPQISEPEPAPKRTAKMISDGQRKKIMALCRERGVTHEYRHERMKTLWNADSVNDLTYEQAHTMIEMLAVLPVGNEPAPPDQTPEQMCGEG